MIPDLQGDENDEFQDHHSRPQNHGGGSQCPFAGYTVAEV
jgi:hypothetical protein